MTGIFLPSQKRVWGLFVLGGLAVAAVRVCSELGSSQGVTLSLAVEWLLTQASCLQSDCRRKCMQLFWSLVPRLPGEAKGFLPAAAAVDGDWALQWPQKVSGCALTITWHNLPSSINRLRRDLRRECQPSTAMVYPSCSAFLCVCVSVSGRF